MQDLLEKKIKQINEMPIQELYKLPQVRRNDYRVYKEAIGLISEDQKRYEQQVLTQRCQESVDPEDDRLLGNILGAK